MRRVCRILTVVAALGLGAAVTAASPTSMRAAPGPTPVIGRPVAVPAHPIAAAPFGVSFKITRSDTRAPLRAGAMLCDPSVAGRMLHHEESFRQGTARLTFLVPASATGKKLTVKLSITAAGRTAKTIATFLVRAAPLPAISIAEVATEEGNSGTTTFAFPVTLSAPSAQAVSVAFATVDATATAPSDSAAASGTLVFNPGETAKAVSIEIVPDLVLERDETFTVALSNPVNATVPQETAIGTIVGDEVDFSSPAVNAVIPQNVATIGCSAGSTYGSGFAITFEWKVRMRDGIRAVDLLAQRRGALRPIVSERIENLDQGSYTFRSCGSFVADGNLTDWYWALRLVDEQGSVGPWAESPFSFATCRLDSGAACNAPPR